MANDLGTDTAARCTKSCAGNMRLTALPMTPVDGLERRLGLVGCHHGADHWVRKLCAAGAGNLTHSRGRLAIAAVE